MKEEMGAITMVPLLCLLHLTEVMADPQPAHPSIIIIGAGISGISTAKTLSDAGINDILILEATDRIGGRVHKRDFAGLQVEMGGNWVEGVNGQHVNPIEKIANKLHLRKFYSNYNNISCNTYKQVGGCYSCSSVQTAMHIAEDVYNSGANFSKSLPSGGIKDISILAFQRLKNRVPTTPLEMVLDYYMYDYENAEPPRVTSLRRNLPLPTFVNFGEDVYFVADQRGYETMIHYLANQFLRTNKKGSIIDHRLKLKKVVRHINYSVSGVTVTTEDQTTFTADYVMVSVSIGVLQTKLINFQPGLPQLDKEFPGANILLVIVSDDEAKRIEQQPGSDTKKEAMEVLRNMFGEWIPEATDILVSRWWLDRLYKGSFLNWPVGVGSDAFNQLKAPFGRIYFTGEHTSELYNGYVHGAYLAGIESANSLIKCIRKGLCKT